MQHLGLDLMPIIQAAGYPGLFLVIFLESGVFFGFFLPGASLLFSAGLLTALGAFDITVLAPLLVFAAILGDSVGYWFGSWVGHAIYARQDSRWFKKKHLHEAHAFFERHGAAAIFLARFVPVVRTFTPIVAGAAEMRYRTFFLWNALGGVIWAGGILMAGYFLGRTIPSAQSYLLPISLLIVIITLIPLLLGFMRKRSKIPRAIMFDLDDTLAPNFQPPTPEMLDRIKMLLKHMPVGIITAAGDDRLFAHIAEKISSDRENLMLFPISSGEGYRFENNAWQRVYANEFSEKDGERIRDAIEGTMKEVDVMQGFAPRGQRYFNRGSQVTYAFLGAEVSREDKNSWDPDCAKRYKLQSILQDKLPNEEVLIGGKTSMDITKKGIDKSLGVRKFAQWTNIPIRDMLYIGDAFYPGGNDTAVIPTGVPTRKTSGPEETARIIDELLVQLSAASK